MEIKELEKKLQNFKNEQQQQKIRGLNNYNIMKVLRNIDAEVGMHSRFISSLLDKDREHYQGELFINLFIEHVIKAKLKDCFDFGKNIKFEEEEATKDNRRIDFTIKSDKYLIGIEMEINANDQDKQIFDYYEELKEQAKNLDIKEENVKIYYLTLDGKEASMQSYVKDNVVVDYTCISFEKEILNWLEASQKEVSNITNLNNAIGYYKDVVNMLLGEYNSPVNQYKDFFFNDKEIYECYEKNEHEVLKYMENNDFIEDGFRDAKQKLYDNFYIKLFHKLFKDNDNIKYFRYIQNSSLQQIQLVVNEYYSVNIFLNKQLDKFISIKVGLAWAYHNEAKGNPKLKILLQQKGKILSQNENIKSYLEKNGKEFEFKTSIPEVTIENLFLKQENELEKLNENVVTEIQKHIKKALK